MYPPSKLSGTSLGVQGKMGHSYPSPSRSDPPGQRLHTCGKVEKQGTWSRRLSPAAEGRRRVEATPATGRGCAGASGPVAAGPSVFCFPRKKKREGKERQVESLNFN